MFTQLGSPSVAVTPVIGIGHSERHCTPVSCSPVHSCAAWLQSCGSPGWLAVPSCECMLCALLFIVLRLCRPTLRIHYWSLQHTPARTYCSPLSRMRSKSQLRLPCQLISIILLTVSISFLILLIPNEQLRFPCRLLVLYCSPLAVLSLYCSSLSSCDFHDVF
jgi:hypothetical protein